jgi:chromosome segregation ATPase
MAEAALATVHEERDAAQSQASKLRADLKSLEKGGAGSPKMSKKFTQLEVELTELKLELAKAKKSAASARKAKAELKAKVRRHASIFSSGGRDEDPHWS